MSWPRAWRTSRWTSRPRRHSSRRHRARPVAGAGSFPLAFIVGAFAVQVLGPGSWALDSVLPVDVLYESSARWVILGLAVAGALVAAFWPTQAPPSEVAEGPSTTEAAPE